MSFSTIRNMAGYVYISPKMNLWSDWWCFFAVSSQSFDIFTFNMLWLNGRSFFRSQKDLRLIYLWASEALEIWLVVMYLYYLNWICGVTGDFFAVYSQSFVVFTFNMLLLNGKPFLRSQKDLRLVYLWASVALEIWLVMYLYDQKWIGGVTGDFVVVSSQNFVVFTFNMLLLNGKSFFRSQKDLRLIYLWASVALEIWLVMYLYDQKWSCGVTGDVFLVFPVKVLLYSHLICYCLIANHFSEVKKTSSSFTYKLQKH